MLRHEVAQRWVLMLKGKNPLTNEDALDSMERLSPQRIGDLLDSLAFAVGHFQPIVAQAFGEDHQRIAWREEMLKTVEEALRLSMWPMAIEENPLRAAVARLSEEKADSAIRRTRKMALPGEESPPNTRLAALCSVPLPQLAALAADVLLLQNFFNSLDRLVQAQASSVDDAVALEQRSSLIDSLVWED